MQLLLLLWFVVEDHDTLFVLSEAVHFVGIGLLAYKLLKKRNCGGGPWSCCRPPTRRRLATAAAAPNRLELAGRPAVWSFRLGPQLPL